MNTEAVGAIVAAVVLALAFEAGYYVRGDHDTAKEVKQVVAEQKQTATNVVQAVQASQKIEEKVQFINEAAATNGRAIHDRVVTQIKYVYKENEGEKQTTVACGPAYLDVGTVRLLNATRQGFSLDPASISNDPGATAPALPIADFVDSDNEVVRRYNELSERHNALVDSVEQHLNDQAAQ